MAFVSIDTSTLVDHAVPGPCCGIYDMPLFVNNPADVEPLPWKCVHNQYLNRNQCVQDSAGTYPTFAECHSVCNDFIFPFQTNPYQIPSNPNYKYVEAPEPCFTDMCCPCGCCRNSEMPKGFWVTVENMHTTYFNGGPCKIVNDGTYYAKVGYAHVKTRSGGVETEYYTKADACHAIVRDHQLNDDWLDPCLIQRMFDIDISFQSDAFNHDMRCVDLAAPQQDNLHQYTRLVNSYGPGYTIVLPDGTPVPPVFYPSLGTKIDYSCNCNCVMYVKTNSESYAYTGDLTGPERVVTPIYNDIPSNLIFIKPINKTCADWSATYTAADFHLDPTYIYNTPDSDKYLLTGFDWKRYSTLSIYGLGAPAFITNPTPVAFDYSFVPRFFFTPTPGFDPVTLSSYPPVDHGTKITITPDYTGGPYATCYPIMSAESASGMMMMGSAGVSIRGASRRSLDVVRPDRCEYLGKRTENRHGCNGWQCRHECDIGLPAVPGRYCQGCESYAVDPDYAGKGPAGWLQ